MLTLRDAQIAETIGRFGAMTTSQATSAFFSGLSARRMAQARLLALHRSRRIDRMHQHGRDTVWVPWRSRSGDLQHRVAVAQVWIDAGTPPDYERDQPIGNLRPDLLLWIGAVPLFVEVERSHNSTARKLAQYQALWRDRESWRDRFSEFPYLLLVVPSPAHVERAEAIPSPPKTVCTPSQVAHAVSSAHSTHARQWSSQQR